MLAPVAVRCLLSDQAIEVSRSRNKCLSCRTTLFVASSAATLGCVSQLSFGRSCCVDRPAEKRVTDDQCGNEKQREQYPPTNFSASVGKELASGSLFECPNTLPPHEPCSVVGRETLPHKTRARLRKSPLVHANYLRLCRKWTTAGKCQIFQRCTPFWPAMVVVPQIQKQGKLLRQLASGQGLRDGR